MTDEQGGDGGEPAGGDNEFDRMSLNSLRRELEVQKAKTAMAREEARDRIEDATEGKTPWGRILLIGSILLVVGGIGFAALAMSLGGDDDWTLPEHELHEFDAGSGEWVFDAGPPPEPEHEDAGRRRHGHGHGGHHSTKQGGDLDFGSGNDPIEGLGGNDPIEGLTE